jgi:hypothetical protein
MKEEEQSRFDILVNSWKRLDQIERLETTELEEKRMELKKTLEGMLTKVQVGRYDDMAIALFNESVGNLVEENEAAVKNRLEPGTLFRPNLSNLTMAKPEAQVKRDIPLLRVHNSVIHDGRVDRPVITYYRMNGAAGRLEEAFAIAGNKNSVLGGGSYYEE